jgi:hypothetical protein
MAVDPDTEDISVDGPPSFTSINIQLPQFEKNGYKGRCLGAP